MSTITSIQWLVQLELVTIYGYVIMPSHIYLIWEQLKINGRELPKNSFKKFTSMTLLNNLKKGSDSNFKNY